jgi:hypothetical protein
VRFLALISLGSACLATGCQPLGRIATGHEWWCTKGLPPDTTMDSLQIAELGLTTQRAAARTVLVRTLEISQQQPLEIRALTLANLGIAATHMGAVDIARSSLDGALAIMDAVIYDPTKSEEILSLSGEERTKVFRGEPHERAIVNLYRGIVYLADGEPESARACFLRADMYSADLPRSGSASGTWLSLEYLAAISDLLSGFPIGLRLPTNIPEELQLDPYTPDDNMIVLFMSGLSPLKQHYKGGKEHGLGYHRVRSQVSSLELLACTSPVTSQPGDVPSIPDTLGETGQPRPSELDFTPLVRLTRPTEDFYLQAISNGRRQMDSFLAEKQAVAERGESLGAGIEWAGICTPPILGLNLLVMSIGSSIHSGAGYVESTADLRSIYAPGYIYIASINSSYQPISLRVLAESGKLLGSSLLPARETDHSRPRVVLARLYD